MSNDVEVKTEIMPIEAADAIEDFEQARVNLTNIIEIGSEAIRNFADLANQSQNPAHYEVLATLIKAVGDSSGKLMTTHKQLDDLINKKKSASKIVNNISNSYFVSSTNDVLKNLPPQPDKGS